MASTKVKRIINATIVIHVLLFAVLQAVILALYGDAMIHPLSYLEIYFAGVSTAGVLYYMVKS